MAAGSTTCMVAVTKGKKKMKKKQQWSGLLSINYFDMVKRFQCPRTHTHTHSQALSYRSCLHSNLVNSFISL